jgi:lipoate-protein ligase A
MLVHHGTLILNEKVINEIEKVLKHPPKEPDYRKKRTHKEFLTSLPENFDVSLFYSCLLDEIKNYFNVIESRFITPKEFKEMKPILLKKVKNVYKNSNWILKGKYELKEIIAENKS